MRFDKRPQVEYIALMHTPLDDSNKSAFSWQDRWVSIGTTCSHWAPTVVMRG